MGDVKLLCDQIIKWLIENVHAAGKKGAVFGLSGGVDSAVVGALCKRAFPEDSLGLIMPCHSNSLDEEHAMLVAENLGIKTKKIVLDEIYDDFLKVLGEDGVPDIVKANIKPRLRMITLYYYAGIYDYLVIGTGNKSELTVGYFTKYGDSGVDLLPIGDLVKYEVRELAYYLEIPEVIINKPPTAGLWANQTDEGEMGITYAELDSFIKTGEADPVVAKKILEMYRKSEHKRNMPKIFKKAEN